MVPGTLNNRDLTVQYENTASHPEWQINLLTLLRPMDFFIKFDTVKPGWSIVYIEGSQVVISKKYCISLSEDGFCLSK